VAAIQLYLCITLQSKITELVFKLYSLQPGIMHLVVHIQLG